MSFSYGWRGPNIVKDGLVLYLDPGSPNSYYNKTGNTITDISGNGNNGTLTNFGSQTIYDSNNGGSIVLDGTNDYIEISSGGNHIPNLTKCSYNFFVKFTNFSKAYNSLAETYDINGGTSNYQFTTLVKSNGKLAFYVFNTLGNQSSYDGTGTFTLSTNTWYMLTFVFQGSNIQQGYVNGVLDGSVINPVASIASSSQNLRLGYSVFADRYPGVRIAQAQIYNRALSAQEILQNFNATRSRFGL